ncbi:MAG: DUF2892 domain-containing protein [Alicyclobacillus sp.]|nr:DUF2892 domain-containing protein [Alicyclobacillus sp.]
MQAQPNLGTLDRYLRLLGGLVLLASGASQRRPSLAKAALLGLGAMKVAEGVTGWCPLLQVAGVSTNGVQSHNNTRSGQRSDARSAAHMHHPGLSNRAERQHSETDTHGHAAASERSHHRHSAESGSHGHAGHRESRPSDYGRDQFARELEDALDTLH